MPTIRLQGKMVGAETVAVDLRQFSATLRLRLRSEVQAQAAQLVGAARALAPRKTGALAASIQASGMETDKAILAAVGTDISRSGAFYGRFQESGYTPNPRHTFIGTSSVLGPWGPAVVSARKAKGSWQRNPRTQAHWKAYAEQRGGRRIVAHPFLKPALAQLRGTFRERLTAITKSVGL
ncbi:MAG: HK97 gp10 family phage protein [Deltaproteobacteria bacterium]